MLRNKKQCLVEQVRRFRARFVQSVGAVLGDVIPAALLIRWITEEIGAYRERIYGPFTSLVLFNRASAGGRSQLPGRGHPGG